MTHVYCADIRRAIGDLETIHDNYAYGSHGSYHKASYGGFLEWSFICVPTYKRLTRVLLDQVRFWEPI